MTPASAASTATPTHNGTFVSRTSSPATPGHGVKRSELQESEAAYTHDTEGFSREELPRLDVQDNNLIVATLQDCGSFITSWGLSGQSLSHQMLRELHEVVADVLLAALQTPQGYGIPIEVTLFTEGFNVLLASYRGDKDALHTSLATFDTAKYKDVVVRGALFLAAAKGILPSVEALYKVLGNSEPKNSKQQTCLHVASIHNQPHVVSFLLQKGATVNARCRDGLLPWTAICGSAAHEEVSQLLIASGARLNDTRPGDVMNSLFQAAAGGHVESVQAMLRRGVDPSYRTLFGWTPLVSVFNLSLQWITD